MKNTELAKMIDDEIGERPESLLDIFDAVAEACRGTADHLVTNWQDPSSAKYWERNARIVENAKQKIQFPW